MAHWRVALLALVTTLIWVAHYDRWTLASWSIPTDYRGDSLEILTRINAAAEGDTVPLRPQVVSRLGAPFGANWSAYPSSDLLLMWLLGRVAAVTGVFTAANLAMLAAAVSAALAFYGCARWLRVRWEWAFACALLFAFTFQTFHRGLPHLFLLFSWTVPMALLAAGMVAASRRLRWPGGGALFVLATAVLIGIGNPYILFLFLQLLGWALVAQWLGARRRDNLVTGGVALGAAIAAFFVVESHVWLFAPDTAAVSPLVRNYGGTERYALKPLELLLPPSGHRWEALGFFGHRYERWSEWRGGEAFAPYLGIVGIVALAWLALTALRAVLQRRRLPGVALPTGWVLAFASIGGLTNVLAFFTGLLVFRATNRFSIFVSCLVLLFLGSRMSRWWRERAARPGASPGWWRGGSIAGAALVAIFGLADQLPVQPGLQRQQAIARRVDADRELGRMLEGRLPRGAMVFQMPVMMFPEVTPPHQLADYEYFRPYLATHSLRFSYGSLKGRSRGRWQRDTEELPTAEFVRRLEAYGFAGLYFSRRGFADGGEKLLAELAAIGRQDRVEGDRHELVVVLLQPSLRPEAPVATTLTFGSGWQNPGPGGSRWAHGPAALSYHNPYTRPMRTRIRLSLSAVTPRTLTLRINGKRQTDVRVTAARRDVAVDLLLPPGMNRIDLEASEPAVRVSQARGQLRSFAVHQTVVEMEPQLLAAR